jgi:hypothetical protein
MVPSIPNQLKKVHIRNVQVAHVSGCPFAVFKPEVRNKPEKVYSCLDFTCFSDIFLQFSLHWP